MTYRVDNMTALGPPTNANDTTQGYGIGSLWAYRDVIWHCSDATANGAVWVPHPAGYEPHPASTARPPINFAGGLTDFTLPTTDQIYVFPFFVTRNINQVGLVVTANAVTAGAKAVFTWYPSNPESFRPDGEVRIGFGPGPTWSSSPEVDLSSGTTGTVRSVSFAMDKIGLYWLAVHTKGVASGAQVKTMTNANGRILGGTTSTLGAGQFPKCVKGSNSYLSSGIATCPNLSNDSGDSPMPVIWAS